MYSQTAEETGSEFYIGTRDGFAIWSKRLEEGTYAMPFTDAGGEQRQEITAQELGAILSGIDLSQAKRRKRYNRGKPEPHKY